MSEELLLPEFIYAEYKIQISTKNARHYYTC